jgi:hypothetical protein
LTFCGLAAWADDPRARAIAPFVDADVVAIGRVDLTKVDVDVLARRLIADQESAAEASQAIAPWIAALRKAGARQIYLLVALHDVMSPANSAAPVIVPLSEGADAKTIGELLCGTGGVKGPVSWPTCATIHQAVFAGSNEALERARQADPAERPELTTALAAVGDTAGELLLVPSADARRVLEETLPNLPRELGGGPITSVSRGLAWAALSLTQDPEPSLRCIVQGKDAASAKALNELGKNTVHLVRQSAQTSPGGADVAKLADDLKPEQNEDRMTLAMDAQKASAWASALVTPIRASTGRAQCTNNLKQIGLAMHNYHDRHKTFPPAYTVDKSGKPLLSWRVLILPYLEQDALYKEFHLDEPWDSPHNRALIDRMPAVYHCPSGSGKRADAGKTTYLTPRGKSTIFSGPEANKIQSVEDGTSNTIFVVDASDARAVIWTKPDDWDVEPALDLKGIFGHHPGGTPFSLADGAVHFIKDSVSPKVLHDLVTRDGGELIDWKSF